jgi:hypothetical protein
VQRALNLNQFPAFCGIIVGGSTLLQFPIRCLIVQTIRRNAKYPLKEQSLNRIIKIFAALVSSYIGFSVLNSEYAVSEHDICRKPRLQSGGSHKHTDTTSSDLIAITTSQDNQVINTKMESVQHPLTFPPSAFAGRTLDLTLFAFVRSVDTAVRLLPKKTSVAAQVRIECPARHPVTHLRGYTPCLARVVSKFAIPQLFSLSAATIMWAWFYAPERLPRSYLRWISRAAELDERLLEALRLARQGKWIYARETGQRGVLGKLCHDCGLDQSLGDPAKTVPIPCIVVHQGMCLSRFIFGSASTTFEISWERRGGSNGHDVRLADYFRFRQRSDIFSLLFLYLHETKAAFNCCIFVAKMG